MSKLSLTQFPFLTLPAYSTPIKSDPKGACAKSFLALQRARIGFSQRAYAALTGSNLHLGVAINRADPWKCNGDIPRIERAINSTLEDRFAPDYYRNIDSKDEKRPFIKYVTITKLPEMSPSSIRRPLYLLDIETTTPLHEHRLVWKGSVFYATNGIGVDKPMEDWILSVKWQRQADKREEDEEDIDIVKLYWRGRAYRPYMYGTGGFCSYNFDLEPPEQFGRILWTDH